MAKLNREGKLREKRAEKQARKAARRLSATRDTAETSSRSDEFGTVSAELDGGGTAGAGRESLAVASDVAGRSI